MTVQLQAQPLSREAFAPFGEVIQTAGAHHYPINDGTTERYHRLAVVESYPDLAHQAAPESLINLFVAQPSALPAKLSLMERHPLGTQAFMPLSHQNWLVVVASTDGPPQARDLQAFVATGEQGVQYRAGVWHHPLLALHTVSQFMVVDRGGPGHNLDEAKLPDTVFVDLES